MQHSCLYYVTVVEHITICIRDNIYRVWSDDACAELEEEIPMNEFVAYVKPWGKATNIIDAIFLAM
jgi:hypothetical protein